MFLLVELDIYVHFESSYLVGCVLTSTFRFLFVVGSVLEVDKSKRRFMPFNTPVSLLYFR